MPEELSLTSAQAAAFSEAHMAAEVELAIESPEFRQSLFEDAAAADEEIAPYYADLFERINKREMTRQRRPFAPVSAPRRMQGVSVVASQQATHRSSMKLTAVVATCLALATVVGCAMQPVVATTRIDEEDVEIIADSSKRRLPQEQLDAVNDEAVLRCGKFGRNAEYVSTRWEDLTTYYSGVAHHRWTFLFQCVPPDGQRTLLAPPPTIP